MHHNEGISANTEFEYLKNIMFQVGLQDQEKEVTFINCSSTCSIAVSEWQHEQQQQHASKGHIGCAQIYSPTDSNGARKGEPSPYPGKLIGSTPFLN